MRRLGPFIFLAGGLLWSVLQPRDVRAGFQADGDTYVLSIGIDHYPAGSGLPSIRFAEADASALPAALTDWIKGGQSSLPQGDVRVSTLMGDKATLAGIRGALRKIAESMTPNDIFILNFDGMGICDAASQNYEFAAYDSIRSPDGSSRNTLTARQLGEFLKQIPADEQFLIFDTCGSRKALDQLRSVLEPPDSQYLTPRVVHLMAPDGASLESPEAKHGILTASLLQGLAGAADADKTKRISWDRLVGYVTWKLPESSNGHEELYSFTLYGNPAGEDRTRAFTQEIPPDSAESVGLGQDYALLVGTDEYPGGWPRLVNPVFDVSSIRKELVNEYGFADDPNHIIEIHNARKHDLVPAIEKLISQHFGQNDRLLVYFAGHGLRTSIDGYVVFADSKPPQMDDATDGMMSFSDLSGILNRIPVRHVLLVMDVCYGGLFDGTVDRHKTNFQSLLGAAGPSAAPSELMRRALEASSRIYITSGDENHQVSDGAPGQHSPFSRRFLDLLHTAHDSEPFLDVSTLVNGLRSLPMEPKAGYFYAAHVEQGADYIFIPAAK